MSAMHWLSKKRLVIGTSPMSATLSVDFIGAIFERVLVGADALHRAHRARTEARAGAIGDAEIHRHADQRDVDAAELARGFRRRPDRE